MSDGIVGFKTVVSARESQFRVKNFSRYGRISKPQNLLTLLVYQSSGIGTLLICIGWCHNSSPSR